VNSLGGMFHYQKKDKITHLSIYPGRLAIQQRVLPTYRVEFFDTLALSCQGGLSVFAGEPRPDESIQAAHSLEDARYSPARNIHMGKISSPYYFCWQRGLVNWLGEWRPDALILEANPRYLSASRAAGWMHKKGRPVIGWGLGSPRTGSDKRGLLARLQNSNRERFYRMFDGMIAYSRQGAEEYRALGFSQERVFVAPNAAIRRRSTPPPVRSASFSVRPSILFVGRLQARKRVDILLSACADLPESLQPDLVIVGDGPDRERLQQLARSIYPQTEFVGAIHGADLTSHFNRADLFVLPGTGGLAVQEAMGQALPVVVAEGDGTQDDLVRPDNGWRVQPGDLGSLRAALVEALSDPEKLRRMGNESYRIVQEEANIEAMVAGFLEALSKIQPVNRGTFDR
jgi:glycosyltransferase involved in cell wall biosynthesis